MGGETVTEAQVALAGALQAVPSKARICRLSLMCPTTNAVWDNCAAVISTTVPAACGVPPMVKLPLVGSRVPSQSWYLVMASPSASLILNRLERDTVLPTARLLLTVVNCGA